MRHRLFPFRLRPRIGPSLGPLAGTLLVLVLFSPILLPRIARAQALDGHVRSHDGEPLPGVNVLVPALQQGAVTDDAGYYRLAFDAPGTYTVSFSYVGFRPETHTVDVPTGGAALDVVMEEDVIEGEEVLVDAERVDVLTVDRRSVSSLEGEELDQLRGQTLGETLEHLPGITTLSTGPSISKPVVRGLHSQRVLVLNAGVPQEGQQWGGEHAPEIDPFAPVRIEVLKGVAGVEYGIGAIGGVIRLEPLPLPTQADQIAGRFAANGFSNNLQGAASLYLEGGVSGLRGLGWRVQGSFRKAGDAHTPDYVIGNTAFQEMDGSVSLGYRYHRFGVEAHYSHFGTELGIYRGAHVGNADDLLRVIERGEPAVDYDFGYGIQPPKQEISHDLVTLRGRYQLASGGRAELQYGFQHNNRLEYDSHRAYNDSLATIDRPAFDLSLFSHSIEGKFQHRPLGNLLGSFGFSGMLQTNANRESGYLIPNFRSYTGGAYVRESFITGPLTLEGGARFDYRWVRAWPRENLRTGRFVKRVSDYASLSGALGALWQFASTWSVGMNLGTAWRPPSVNELYNFGVHHGTATFEIGAPELGAERSLGLDATLRQHGPRTHLEFAAYVTRFQDFIFLHPDPEPTTTIRGAFPTFRYTQADARLLGADLLVEFEAFPFLLLRTTASIVRGDNVDTGDPLLNMPGDRVEAATVWRFPDAGVLHAPELELTGRFVRRQTRFVEGVDYADPPPGYALYQAAARTEVHVGAVPVHLSLAVYNLFDTSYRDYLSRYRYFIDDPGRSFVLRLQVPIGRFPDSTPHAD